METNMMLLTCMAIFCPGMFILGGLLFRYTGRRKMIDFNGNFYMVLPRHVKIISNLFFLLAGLSFCMVSVMFSGTALVVSVGPEIVMTQMPTEYAKMPTYIVQLASTLTPEAMAVESTPAPPEQEGYFKDNFRGEWHWTVANNETYTADYVAGGYWVQLKGGGTVFVDTPDASPVFENMAVSAVMQQVNEGGLMGVTCRVQNQTDFYYGAVGQINGKTAYIIGRSWQGEMTQLASGTLDMNIQQETTLTLTCEDNWLTLSVNGRPVGSASDDQISSGRAGIFATGEGEEVLVLSFEVSDNLKKIDD